MLALVSIIVGLVDINANLVFINANTFVATIINANLVVIYDNTLATIDLPDNANYPKISPFGIDGNTSSLLRIDGQSSCFSHTSLCMSH